MCITLREKFVLEPQILEMNVDDLTRHSLAMRVDEWMSSIRSSRKELPFDDWMVLVATPIQSAEVGLRLTQGNVSFELGHGKRYAIRDAARGAQTFRCIIDGREPLVAFIDKRGRRGPWLTVGSLFTVEQILSMRELPE